MSLQAASRSDAHQKRGGGRKRVSGARKRGTTVTFGSAKWELVVQMMLGIRLAVGRGAEAAGEAVPARSLREGSSPAGGRSERSMSSVSEGGGSAREESPSPRAAAAVAVAAAAAGAPGSSTQHTTGGGGGGGGGGTPHHMLRHRASAARLDRSEPFTILLTKGAASTLLGVSLRACAEGLS